MTNRQTKLPAAATRTTGGDVGKGSAANARHTLGTTETDLDALKMLTESMPLKHQQCGRLAQVHEHQQRKPLMMDQTNTGSDEALCADAEGDWAIRSAI